MISSLLFAAAAATASLTAPQFILEEHPTLRFSDKTFVLGRMRWDYEHRGPDESLPHNAGPSGTAGKDGWAFIRRRFSIEGNIKGKFAFEIETDLEGDEFWKDVYGEYIASPALRVRAGKFVVPFGYERTTSIDVLDFAYRSIIATHLVPPRDRGVMVFGRLADGKVSYDAGAFEDGGGTFAARIVVRLSRALEMGVAGMHGGFEDDRATLRGTTALGVEMFRVTNSGEGRRQRLGAHAAYRSGPAAIKAEYITLRDSPDTSVSARGAGWYLAGALVLTGESEADSHHPRHPITKGGIGSVEVAARTEFAKFSPSDQHAPVARAHTFGATWQPHRFFRVQWNAIRDVWPGRAMWSRVLRFHLTI